MLQTRFPSHFIWNLSHNHSPFLFLTTNGVTDSKIFNWVESEIKVNARKRKCRFCRGVCSISRFIHPCIHVEPQGHWKTHPRSSSMKCLLYHQVFVKSNQRIIELDLLRWHLADSLSSERCGTNKCLLFLPIRTCFMLTTTGPLSSTRFAPLTLVGCSDPSALFTAGARLARARCVNVNADSLFTPSYRESHPPQSAHLRIECSSLFDTCPAITHAPCDPPYLTSPFALMSPECEPWNVWSPLFKRKMLKSLSHNKYCLSCACIVASLHCCTIKRSLLPS